VSGNFKKANKAYMAWLRELQSILSRAGLFNTKGLEIIVFEKLKEIFEALKIGNEETNSYQKNEMEITEVRRPISTRPFLRQFGFAFP
jgi:hypothetical protein